MQGLPKTPEIVKNEPDPPLTIQARITRVVKFSLVGASGVLVILLLTWMFTEYLGWFYLLSAAVAMEVSVLWTFALNTKVTFRYTFKESSTLVSAIAKYQLITLAGNLISLVLIFAFTTTSRYFLSGLRTRLHHYHI